MCKKHLEYVSHVLPCTLSNEVCFDFFKKTFEMRKVLKNDCIITMSLDSQAYSRLPGVVSGRRGEGCWRRPQPWI